MTSLVKRKIRLIYFRPDRGTYYSEGTLEVLEVVNDYKVYEIVRGLLQTRNLPGLMQGHSLYDVVVLPDNGVPELIKETSTSETA